MREPRAPIKIGDRVRWISKAVHHRAYGVITTVEALVKDKPENIVVVVTDEMLSLDPDIGGHWGPEYRANNSRVGWWERVVEPEVNEYGEVGL